MTEPSIDERIEILTGLLDTELSDTDRPEVLGELGMAWGERYADTSDEAALNIAIDYLHQALDAETADAPGAPRWLFWLGHAHGELGFRHDSLERYDLGVDCFAAAFDFLGPDDEEEYDELLLDWMNLLWDRFWRMRYAVGGEREGIVAAVDELVTDLSSRSATGGDAAVVDAAAAYVGAARVLRFEFIRARPDLDDGIATLAGSLPRLPDDFEKLPVFRTTLARAYLKRAELDDDAISLDRAIAVGREAIAAIDAGVPTWGSIQLNQALACERRWDRDGDPDDLDASIDSWRAQIAEELDDYVAWRGGDVLRQRAERDGDPADFDEAIELFTYAAQHPEHDEYWLPWYRLGELYQVRAEVLRDPAGLDDAMDCFDRAVAFGLPEEARYDVHAARLSAAVDAARVDDLERRPRSAARLPGVTDEAESVFEELPDRHPYSYAHLAGRLAMARLKLAGERPEGIDSARVRRLAAIGREMPDPPAAWLAAMDVATRIVDFSEDMWVVGGQGEASMADLARIVNDVEVDLAMRAEIRRMLPVFLFSRSMRSGDRRGRAAAEMAQRSASAPEASDDLVAFMTAVSYLERGEYDAFLTMFRGTDQPIADLPEPLATHFGVLAAHLEGRRVERTELIRPVADRSGYAPDTDIMTCVVTSCHRYLEGVTANDLPALREYGADLDSLGTMARPGRVAWLGLALIAGITWLEVARRDRTDREAARRAAHWYGGAVRSVGGPKDPNWTTFTLGLAESRRLAGDPDLAGTRSLGRSAMAGHAWQVMLQSGTDYAIQAARAASADAARVARWCLADGADDDLLSVLDAGRGLSLQAATVSRGLAGRLAAAGHAALAAEWRETSGRGRDRLTGDVLPDLAGTAEIPDDLRERALRALSVEDGPPDDVVTDVRLADVQRALVAAGADALVYLLPASGNDPGVAVVVPASGPVAPIPLPDLATGGEIDRWTAPDRRDAHAAAEVPDASDDDRLDSLCRWAWTAGAGPLLAHLRGERPARLVLVPMGPLGLVPWHAAYTPTTTGRRYALDDAVFSYAVSAREFARDAHRPARPIRSSLVVGDPTGGLAFASVEARAVHERFHPTGAYLDSEATPDAVLDWLAGAVGPSLLHFACHAAVDPRAPLDAHLVLAGGRTLTARRLLDASHPVALDIERAFLAACSTHGIGADYDETFSLATAFLAAGARTVFGSLWPVPDTDTSMLMYMIHHHLAAGLAPADALHRAQRWMLDPRRVPPDGMPDALARACADPALARPVAWAGFTHLGR